MIKLLITSRCGRNVAALAGSPRPTLPTYLIGLTPLGPRSDEGQTMGLDCASTRRVRTLCPPGQRVVVQGGYADPASTRIPSTSNGAGRMEPPDIHLGPVPANVP